MPQRAPSSSSLMRPFVVLALPGMYLLYKYNQYRQQQMETARRRVTERELMHLNTKINSDIVLILESGYMNSSIPLERRFHFNAPRIRRYADRISHECPRAFVIVCTTPVDCMVPLVAETLKETGWYDPRRLMGSMALQEMRATTLVAEALNLDPQYTRVPCVGGTEGEALVPLFSKAVKDFDFVRSNAEIMTQTVRSVSADVYRLENMCSKNAELSEAHALAGLVKNVAHALLCQDVARVTGFVEADLGEVISPVSFFGMGALVNRSGICKKYYLPGFMSELELDLTDQMWVALNYRLDLAYSYYNEQRSLELKTGDEACQSVFMLPKPCPQVYDCRDKLLNKLEENEPELATSPEEECVICVNAKATMQTSPCGHRVVCRRCFVKTIQMAVSQRLLPLRCVICRAKILRLRQAPRLVTSKSWQVSSSSGKSWGVPGSVSSYSVGARSVPASASLYSVTSGESSLSGVSSVSSNSGGNVSNVSSTCSTKLCGGSKCGGACLGAVPRAPTSAPPRARQPASNSLRRSQHHSMKARLQEYQVHSYTGGPAIGEPSGRLPPIREFQREFREGRRESAAAASASTRIRCAQKIVTQLETSPQKKSQHFFRPLKPSSNEDTPRSRDPSKETERIKENPKAKPKKEDKKKKEEENGKKDDKSKKDETTDNRKNEVAEKKKEEKLRLKAEKEAKKEAKLLAKEEERQAKLLAKEEERQAKLLAKEEKKKAKKEAKLAAQADKDKEKEKK